MGQFPHKCQYNRKTLPLGVELFSSFLADTPALSGAGLQTLVYLIDLSIEPNDIGVTYVIWGCFIYGGENKKRVCYQQAPRGYPV